MLQESLLNIELLSGQRSTPLKSVQIAKTMEQTNLDNSPFSYQSGIKFQKYVQICNLSLEGMTEALI
jgi:hypothetical protein